MAKNIRLPAAGLALMYALGAFANTPRIESSGSAYSLDPRAREWLALAQFQEREAAWHAAKAAEYAVAGKPVSFARMRYESEVSHRYREAARLSRESAKQASAETTTPPQRQ